MSIAFFPVIDPAATGANILRLRKERGLTVRDLQAYFGFEEPQAIYKWQSGKSLPSVDNLYALGALLGVPMEEILVPTRPIRMNNKRQQDHPAAVLLFRLLEEYGALRVSWTNFGMSYCGFCRKDRAAAQFDFRLCLDSKVKGCGKGRNGMLLQKAERQFAKLGIYGG